MMAKLTPTMEVWMTFDLQAGLGAEHHSDQQEHRGPDHNGFLAKVP